MSALTLRGPEQLVVRQHRLVLWVSGVVALAGIALVAGAWWFTSSAADDFAGTGCSVQHTVQGCGIQVRHFLSVELYYSHLFNYAALFMTALPALVGLFVAGPVIGRELEDGTYRFAWGQSMSPARWLAAKLAVPGALTVAGVAVLSAVYAWGWSRTYETHYPSESSEPLVFGSMGPVPVASALLGLALGALIALLVRRTLASMTLTVVVSLGLIVAREAVRPDGAFWPLQLTETGILLVLTAAATALAFRVLRRYHA
ncbi:MULTISPECIES: hypothetical protein [unclassified Streptomyces]|uniref:hypothetical protein n=1 Tax=unclassified Streptomyces TaxID=2593676 RepID=UPI00037ABD83|nr:MULTISPECIES: hypothetical protein [unclassified Streptomyces]MYQ78547.1 hypothetical protein [Streptomyces sp. SID4923]